MAYIASDGSIQQYKPWSLSKVVDIFWDTLSFFTFFFRSMFHMDDPSQRGQYGSRSQRAPHTPRRGVGGVSRISGVAPPPCGMGGG